MPTDKKIKDLTGKTVIAATDEIAINDVANGNVDKKENMADIKTFMSNSPTLVTPALGTPTSGNLTNCNALPQSGVTNLTTDLGNKVTSGGALGTPLSGTLTNCTGLPSSGVAPELTGKTLTDPIITSSENAQVGTAYTLVIGDTKTYNTFTNASAVTVTIPPNSSVAFPVGCDVRISQNGAGQVTVSQGAGVTIVSTGAIPSAPKIRAQYGACIAHKLATDTWQIVGDIV